MKRIVLNDRDEKIIEFLKEYGCNLNNYNPYKSSDTPKFRKDNVNWF